MCLECVGHWLHEFAESSFGLVDAIVAVTTDGEGWSDVAPSLLLLAGWCVVLFGAGIVTLRRRVAAL